MYVTPDGRISVIFTFNAANGPLFLTTTVYVSVSPMLAAALFTVLVSCTSAPFTVASTVEVLSVKLTSTWSKSLMYAVLYIFQASVPAFTVVVYTNVLLVTANVGTVQLNTLVPASYAHEPTGKVVTFTNVNP